MQPSARVAQTALQSNGGSPVRVAVVSRQLLISGLLRLALDAHDGIQVVFDVDHLDGKLEQLLSAEPDVVLLCADKQGAPTETIRTLTQQPDAPKVIVLRNAPTNDMIAEAFDAGASGCISLQLPLVSVVQAIAGDAHPMMKTTNGSAQVPAQASATEKEGLRYLTRRERDVLLRFTNGESTRSIAEAMGVSITTVRTHTQHILIKLGVHSKIEAAAYAVRNELGQEAP